MNRLEEVRLLNKYTKNQIAEILGVSNKAYSNWEDNRETIPLRRLVQLANLYKINIDYLIGLTNIKLSKTIKSYIDINKVALRGEWYFS